MKNLLIFSFTFLLALNLTAQTEKFSKKTWKTFNKSITENLNAAQQFYKGNIDFENRNEDNGFPTSKIKLPNATGNFLETAGYSSFNTYDFKTVEEAQNFLTEVKNKLDIPGSYESNEEDGIIYITSIKEAGMKPTVEIELYEKQVSFIFAPPLDINIPMDIE